MKQGTAVGLVMAVASMAQAKPMPQPEPEVKPARAIDLPAVPDFALTPPDGDIHDPRELRVAGAAFFDHDIKVRGYVTWIYDCLKAVQQPRESRAQAQKRIDDDPTQCERPKLYLGTTRDTSPEKALWVVDVPRPPNKLERERLPKEQLDAWPQVPTIKVGDYVVITGKFATRSPHKESNSDGLIVFGSIEPAKPGRAKAAVATASIARTPPKVPTPPPETPVDRNVRDASVILLNSGNRLLGQKQFPDARAAYEGAVKVWPDNDLAWYGLALVDMEDKDYAGAAAAMDHSVALRPDVSMYQMLAGIAAYELHQGGTAADLASAREHLELAIAIEPNLWRAHYRLADLLRDTGDAHDAATEFSRAIPLDPRNESPYIGLAALYRKWDYTDQAIAVATAGTANVPGGSAPLHYVLGMAYEDKHDPAHAIEHYTRALDLDPTYRNARFQRGQAYFKKRDFARARADLEVFAKDPAGGSFAQAQANQMLVELATKK